MAYMDYSQSPFFPDIFLRVRLKVGFMHNESMGVNDSLEGRYFFPVFGGEARPFFRLFWGKSALITESHGAKYVSMTI